MARVTVEDCLKNVKNRFELVLIAAKRARQLMRGKEPLVEWDNDKATVVALREIAAGYTDFEKVENEQEAEAAHLIGFIKQTEVIVAEELIEDAIEDEMAEDIVEATEESAEDINIDTTEQPAHPTKEQE